MLLTITACGPIVPETGDATTLPPALPGTTGDDSALPPPDEPSTAPPDTTPPAVPATGVIVAGAGVLGHWDGGWISATPADPPPASAGDRYTLVDALGPVGTSTGGSPVAACDPVPENLAVPLDPDPYAAFDPFTPDPVAISAGWDVAPRPVAPLEVDSEVYRPVVADHLASRGFDLTPVIVQLFRVDLDGDGSDEVVIVADNHGGAFFQENVYSVVLVRTVVDGDVQTAVLADSIVGDIGEGEVPFSVVARVAALADLNGDATMEIVLDLSYYEGRGSELWEWAGPDLGFALRLQTGCGA